MMAEAPANGHERTHRPAQGGGSSRDMTWARFSRTLRAHRRHRDHDGPQRFTTPTPLAAILDTDVDSHGVSDPSGTGEGPFSWRAPGSLTPWSPPVGCGICSARGRHRAPPFMSSANARAQRVHGQAIAQPLHSRLAGGLAAIGRGAGRREVGRPRFRRSSPRSSSSVASGDSNQGGEMQVLPGEIDALDLAVAAIDHVSGFTAGRLPESPKSSSASMSGDRNQRREMHVLPRQLNALDLAVAAFDSVGRGRGPSVPERVRGVVEPLLVQGAKSR